MWQIPLLAVSVGLFVAGLLQLRPVIPKATFDDHLRDVRVDLEAERYDQASQILTSLLNGDTDLTDHQRAIAHRMLAETIYHAESPKTSHNPENARRILSNFTVAQKYGDLVQDADYRKMAQAADWMGDVPQALAAYDKALDKQGTDRIAVLERIIEILLGQAKRNWEQIDGYMDQLFKAAADKPAALLRAVQWKVQRLLSRDDMKAAKQLIDSVEAKLDVPPWSYHLQYFQALILFRQQQMEAAEARLRSLQAHLRRSDSLYAQAGWLLGKINYIENRPELALAFYDEVVRTHVGTEYELASLLGKAESLAALERYAAAAKTYEQVIDELGQSRQSMLLDEQAIRESLWTLGDVLLRKGRGTEALPFVLAAQKLAANEPPEVLAPLVELEARIHVQAGDDCLQEAHNPQTDVAEPATVLVSGAATSQPAASTQAAASQLAQDSPASRAKDHFARAGEAYARLAKLRVLNGPLAEDADWSSAHCFERSGRRGRAIRSYRAFIDQHPKSARTPEAMHRLGQELQDAGKVGAAIVTYEALLKKFGRTPPALASLVPLARCHIAHGKKGYDKAEQVLLSIVESDPDKPGLFDPAASEFRDALMELANLYILWDKPERAIERLEQALSLYPNAPEATRLQYELADAYRTSGQGLLDQASKTTQQTQSDDWTREAQRRLERARRLFDRVAGELDARPGPLTPAEQVFLKTSYTYRADCAFDVGKYTEAADLYGRVAWRWQNDPVALAAYVQIVRSYMAAGDLEAARSALARARWILRRIPDTQFSRAPDFRSKAYWTQLFDWVDKTGFLKG